MAQQDFVIREDHVRKEGAVLWRGEYRVRLINAANFPILGDNSQLANQPFFLVDYPSGSASAASHGESGDFDEDDKENVPMRFTKSEDDGPMPVQFEFLSLGKLRLTDPPAHIKIKCYEKDDAVEINGLHFKKARVIQQLLSSVQYPIIGSDLVNNATSPVFLAVDGSDPARTLFLGVQRTPQALRIFTTEAKGALTNATKMNMMAASCTMPKELTRKVTKRAHIEILGAADDEDGTKRATAYLTIDYAGSSLEIAVCPLLSETGCIVFVPGWNDRRLQYSDRCPQMQFLLEVANALSHDVSIDWEKRAASIPMNMRRSDAELVGAVRELIETTDKMGVIQPGKRFLDFTERLVEILHACPSNESLVKCFQTVFSALRSKSINAIMHEDNRSQLAHLVREACKGTGRLALPRLEGLTPLEMLLEIAVERFRRDTIHEFVSRGFVASEKEILEMIEAAEKKREGIRKAEEDNNAELRSPVVADAYALLPLHFALQHVAFFSDFAEVKLSQELTTLTRNVLLSMATGPPELLSSMMYKVKTPLIDIKKGFLDANLPSKLSTETSYTADGHERVRRHVLCSAKPPLAELQSLLTNVEKEEERYVVTLTTTSTINYSSNAFMTRRPSN